MNNPIIVGAASIAVAAGLIVGSTFLPANAHPDKTLTKDFRGMPAGVNMSWDNGKYVPDSVPGYASKADYPDSFWVYDPQNLP